MITAPFSHSANLQPYDALRETVPLDELNPKTAALTGRRRREAIASSHMNFDRPDVADSRLLRTIVRDSLP
ncbi:MAG: hypothetical protein JO177_00160 [Candidatus Eremiobacteraeota bacterium]|nr:hypothetical protein [Candidatus Eremiobacteraeota bacterium]